MLCSPVISWESCREERLPVEWLSKLFFFSSFVMFWEDEEMSGNHWVIFPLIYPLIWVFSRARWWVKSEMNCDVKYYRLGKRKGKVPTKSKDEATKGWKTEHPVAQFKDTYLDPCLWQDISFMFKMAMCMFKADVLHPCLQEKSKLPPPFRFRSLAGSWDLSLKSSGLRAPDDIKKGLLPPPNQDTGLEPLSRQFLYNSSFCGDNSTKKTIS